MANLVFWVFKNGSSRFIVGVISTHCSLLGFGIIQFEIFGLEVCSGAFPKLFRRVVRFVASWALWILFFGILEFVAFLFLLSFEFSTFIFDMSWFFAIVAGDIWVNAQGKEASTRSCCCGHCGNVKIVTFRKSIQFSFTLEVCDNLFIGNILKSRHIDQTFQFGRPFSIKQTVNHCLGVCLKGFSSALVEFFAKIKQLRGIRVEYQFRAFLLGGCLRVRFEIFLRKTASIFQEFVCLLN